MVEHPEVQLKAAPVELAGAMSLLHCRLFEKGWDVGGIRRLLEHPAAMALVATRRHEPALVGFIIAQLSANEVEILSIGVEASQQRQGIGGALVEGLVELARRREVRRVFLDVAEGNAPALALYSKLGFRRMGVRKEYYLHPDGRREDALLMVCDI